MTAIAWLGHAWPHLELNTLLAFCPITLACLCTKCSGWYILQTALLSGIYTKAKYIFCSLKRTCLEQFSPLCERVLINIFFDIFLLRGG